MGGMYFRGGLYRHQYNGLRGATRDTAQVVLCNRRNVKCEAKPLWIVCSHGFVLLLPTALGTSQDS